jgi:hypothetical protein
MSLAIIKGLLPRELALDFVDDGPNKFDAMRGHRMIEVCLKAGNIQVFVERDQVVPICTAYQDRPIETRFLSIRNPTGEWEDFELKPFRTAVHWMVYTGADSHEEQLRVVMLMTAVFNNTA